MGAEGGKNECNDERNACRPSESACCSGNATHGCTRCACASREDEAARRVVREREDLVRFWRGS
jgi:hypothetical protein